MVVCDLHLGKCEDIMKMLPAESVDLVVTSPPYDKLRDYEGYSFNFEEVAKELFRVTKDGGILVWVVGDSVIDGSESLTSFKQALYFKEIGFNVHDTMIYKKNAIAMPDKTRYYQCFEYMFVFVKGKLKTFNPLADRPNKRAGEIKTHRNFKNADGLKNRKDEPMKPVKEIGRRWNVWEYNTGWMKSTVNDYAFEHPAIFPEELARDHILSWSNENDVVLDPMMGSGTTGKVARMLKRNFIGVEISEKYFEIAKRRCSVVHEVIIN